MTVSRSIEHNLQVTRPISDQPRDINILVSSGMLAAVYKRSLCLTGPLSARTLVTGLPSARGYFSCSTRSVFRRSPSSPVSVLSHVSSLRHRFSSTVVSLSAKELSSNASTSTPILPTPGVGHWLLLSSTLVFAVIVVGGVTRLTESGLSITEWRPITGVLPPLSHGEWLEEFEKYKATPEFKLYVPLVLVSLLLISWDAV